MYLAFLNNLVTVHMRFNNFYAFKIVCFNGNMSVKAPGEPFQPSLMFAI
jgi:hypothetical protein